MTLECDYCNIIAIYFYKDKMTGYFYHMCEKHNTFFFIKNSMTNDKKHYVLYTQSEYISFLKMNEALE